MIPTILFTVEIKNVVGVGTQPLAQMGYMRFLLSDGQWQRSKVELPSAGIHFMALKRGNKKRLSQK